MVESPKREVLEYEKYNNNSYNFQDENSIRIDPYTNLLLIKNENLKKIFFINRIYKIINRIEYLNIIKNVFHSNPHFYKYLTIILGLIFVYWFVVY
jgi:hypothetical protein